MILLLLKNANKIRVQGLLYCGPSNVIVVCKDNLVNARQAFDIFIPNVRNLATREADYK